MAIQVLGSAVGVFALAERNGISITDRLKDGMVLEYDLGDIVDSRTAELVAARDICPATEIPQKDESALIRRVWPWRFRPMRPPILPLGHSWQRPYYDHRHHVRQWREDRSSTASLGERRHTRGERIGKDTQQGHTGRCQE